MILWTIMLALTAATATALLWPLMRAPVAGTVTAEATVARQRLRLIATWMIITVLPAGAVLLYAWLGYM